MCSDPVQTRANDWANRLGREHSARDESLARQATVQEERTAEAAALSIERWVTIVGAIRRLIDVYNAGANGAVLSVVEQSGQPTVTITAGGQGAAYLTASLEDTNICMRYRDARGIAYATDFHLCRDRGDDATAAYLLQNWMQHL